MATSTLSNKGVAYALLAIVGTAVVYLFGFSRGIDIVTKASRQRADNTAKIEALRKKLTDLKALEQRFAAQKSQVDVLTVAMPADKQAAEVVAMLETMAARSRVSLENVQPAAATADGLPVAVTVRGDYGGILSFAELIEKNVRPFKFGPINIATGEKDLSATFHLVALYQVPADDLPKKITPTEEGTK